MKEIPLTDEEKLFLKHSNYIENEPGFGDAFDDAARAWHDMRGRPELHARDILLCHAQLMRTRTSIPDAAKGAWTTVQTGIYAGGLKIRQNPAPIAVPNLIEAWVQQINRSLFAQAGFPDPDEKEEVAIGYHVSFEQIHPFQDGNGRVGRILYNWHRLRLGLPIHVITLKEVNAYYRWFRK